MTMLGDPPSNHRSTDIPPNHRSALDGRANALVTVVLAGEPRASLHQLAVLSGNHDVVVTRSLARLEHAGLVEQQRGWYWPTRQGEMRAAEMAQPA